MIAADWPAAQPAQSREIRGIGEPVEPSRHGAQPVIQASRGGADRDPAMALRQPNQRHQEQRPGWHPPVALPQRVRALPAARR